jgi:hypothetical protein
MMAGELPAFVHNMQTIVPIASIGKRPESAQHRK